MKTIMSIFSLLLLVISVASPAIAEETNDDEMQTSVEATTAVWGNHFEEESSKAEEYGEVPEGFLINHFKADLRLKDNRYLEVRGKRVGLNNGQYGFDYGVFGKYALNVDYTKIPHLFSRSGETIWNEASPGVWRIADNIQQTIENLADLDTRRTFVSGLLTNAHPQALGLQRNRTTIGFKYTPTTALAYGFEYFLENRDGYRPFGTAFGFSWATELPERVDYDTQNIHAGLEYTKNRKSLTVSYDLSLFDNHLNAMIWDNPLIFNDNAALTGGDGASQGRLQFPTDNMANTIKVSAASGAGRGRVTGSFAYTVLTDEVDLLPFTINTAIPVIPLPATTFNGKWKNLNVNLHLRYPVGSQGNFTADYRLYDNQNDNDRLAIREYVRMDSVAGELERVECNPATLECEEEEDTGNHIFSYRTNTFDLGYSWRLSSRVKWFAGYEFERWDREERDTTQTDTNMFKTGIVSSSSQLALRFSYEYSQRTSDDFEVDNPVFLFSPLRRFDVANRNRNRVRAVADFTPTESTSLGFNVGLTKDDYVDTLYGVKEWNIYSLGVDFSYAFKGNSNFNVWYEYEKMTRNQQGRQSNGATPSQTTDTDWTVDLENQFHTFGVGYTLGSPSAKTKWDINASYALADGLVDVTAGPVLRPTGAFDLPDVDDTDLFTLKTSLDFKILKETRLGFFYWYEKYMIDDFAEKRIQTDLILIPNPEGGVFTAGTITLNGIQPDYEFHSGWVGLICRW